jgi:hypothetical protein
LDLKGYSGDLPLYDPEVGGVIVKSRVRVSSDSVSGADQRLGNGIWAWTRSTVPDVSTSGIEGGIKLLISYLVSSNGS